MFVIGDASAHAIGNVVNFWGAQWSKNNPTTGVAGNGVSSFKGFAGNADNFCGGQWSGRPGNSGHPPAKLPEHVAIIVTSTVSKAGPSISGNIKEILMVKPAAGYAGNPGHAGTGTVVSVVCHP
jgi:hypothetical protein